jgi:pantoate--beta-alanine ligase
MQAWAETRRREGRRIVLVPTMGYLHDGHLSLLRRGRMLGDELVMSLFVNPTQFGPGEDLDRYPRDEAGDLDKAARQGVDLVFCPAASAMYTSAHDTSVDVHALSRPLCGASRPGHFSGVATVVCKLFLITKPHVAVFGEKDFQQLALIRRMVTDLSFDVVIESCPIVRERDGLALSSRNAYLSAEERRQATTLHAGLALAAGRHQEGLRDARALEAKVREHIASAPLANIDYVEVRDATTLAAIDTVDSAAVLAVAVRFGATRLIDNVVLGATSAGSMGDTLELPAEG